MILPSNFVIFNEILTESTGINNIYWIDLAQRYLSLSQPSTRNNTVTIQWVIRTPGYRVRYTVVKGWWTIHAENEDLYISIILHNRWVNVRFSIFLYGQINYVCILFSGSDLNIFRNVDKIKHRDFGFELVSSHYLGPCFDIDVLARTRYLSTLLSTCEYIHVLYWKTFENFNFSIWNKRLLFSLFR